MGRSGACEGHSGAQDGRTEVGQLAELVWLRGVDLSSGKRLKQERDMIFWERVRLDTCGQAGGSCWSGEQCGGFQGSQ